ncbi:GTP pyrophosphokinase [Rhizobium sp. AG855]|uniref:GTP pyrophosphokinase n=1 Tax=Rhizobium sp. AG855 TaxID=2183898 RepID=UPI000E73EDBE|nr:GTP pyrophosphokinase [Rhizobium sp. AG855]RKE84667.1 ppGpp synthetase/RelA/SpoT-type nucleotidyltransferase [Rhizobium sp. AG855]
MDFEREIDDLLPKYRLLTASIESIIKNLIEQNNIDYLSISGRTKNKEGILEKIKRKNYKNPKTQITDISGVRVILFVESDIKLVSDIIEGSFVVDRLNSSNKDENLSLNQVGYRSVHFVCDLGEQRSTLPEFQGLENLKFEIQIRTVLQHAWAEMAHDRSYKFRGQLPSNIQRRLYLHAGLLEIADKGFSELATEIDDYTRSVNQSYEAGNLDIEINSISLTEFIQNWAEKNNYPLEDASENVNAQVSELVVELAGFGIKTISQLSDLIPSRFVQKAKELNFRTNIFGLVRNFMIIEDVEKIMNQKNVKWTFYDPNEDPDEIKLLRDLSTEENFVNIRRRIDEEMYEAEDHEYAPDDDDFI